MKHQTAITQTVHSGRLRSKRKISRFCFSGRSAQPGPALKTLDRLSDPLRRRAALNAKALNKPLLDLLNEHGSTLANMPDLDKSCIDFVTV